MLRAFWLFCAALLVLGGCTSGAGAGKGSPGSGSLGDACQKTEDCASGLCVRVDAAGGVCTQACSADAGCPASDNWACLTSDDGTNLKLCACRKLASAEVCGDGLDNDCNGKVDDCRVCNGRAVPDDDPLNCGACGTACLPGQSCAGGKCTCPDAAATACATGCVDVTSDPQNCGACGTDCGSARSCKAGACQCSDAAAADFCAETGCVSLQDDASNCGGCGKACTLAQVCKAGSCACPSTDAPDFCAGTGCVNQQKDNQNCGACGTQCPTGQVCSGGACGCPTGQTLCNGTCVDTQTSTANCGACGAACGPVQACSGATCGCTDFGFAVCGAVCANTATDAAHCGSCDHACAAGETCANSKCSCPSGVYCDGVCVSAGDTTNCGACGNACSAGQSCSNGQCRCQGFGLSSCGGTCTDLSSDEANCGTCGTACPAAESCRSGSCACSASGQTYCAASASCVTLSSDTSHCGACGTACKPTQVCAASTCQCPTYGQQFCAAQNQCLDTLSDTQNCGACGNKCSPSQVCSGGVCSCPTSGQLYCASAGKCVDTLSNTADCGACDTKCLATEVCSGGSCQCPTYGQTFCANANACVVLSTDANNCGVCNNKCPAATHCAGYCQCDTAGLSLCGSTCSNLQTDPAHCGSCSNACTGSFSCIAGKCACPDPSVGTAVRLTNNTLDEYDLSAAWDGTHVGVAYRRVDPIPNDFLTNVRFALLNPDGTVFSDTAITTFTTYPDQVETGPVLVWTGTEYGLAWEQPLSNQRQVRLVRINADGTIKAAAITVTSLDPTYDFYNVDLAWSASYGGYAISTLRNSDGMNEQLTFGRIGATGATPDPVNSFVAPFSSQFGIPIAAAPDGTWAIASQDFDNTVALSVIDANGARTAPVQDISTGNQFGSGHGGPWLLQDAQGWLTGYMVHGTFLANSIFINRGASADKPKEISLASSTSAEIESGSLALVNGTLAIGFSELPTSSSASARFRMQRFALPANGSSAVTAIHNIVDILGSANVTAGKYGDVQLVATGKYSMLGIWADNRWGTTRELYAAPIDLHSCP